MSGPIIWDEKKKVSTDRVTIDPITRLEGHGKIEIFLDKKGNVSNAYWQVPEVRGFERFCIGRKVTELNQITARLCGVCPGAHHLASTKAIDGCYGAKPTEAAFLLRDTFYHAHFVHSHIAHFYALAAPDFVCGPAAPAAERNVLGVVARVGLELGAAVLKARAQAQKIQAIIGGKPTHPLMGVPGGVSKAVNKEEAKEIQGYSDELVKFAETSLGVFKSVVLENKEYVDIITNKDLFYNETYHMGLVNGKNQLEFHDGPVRVVGQDGKEHDKYDPKDYLDHIGEAVEPWSYEKFPYLRKPGYKGLVDGKDSGMYRATPLSRLNVSDSISTPKAQAAFEEYKALFKSLGVEGPVQFTLATHWARIIELLFAAEKLQQDAYSPDLTDANIKQKDLKAGGRGVGCVEAPRGTLTHDYTCDENGIVTACNLVVGTTNNNGPINMDTVKAAKGLIKNFEVSPGLLNMVEMAFRAYDPCNSCATHSLPGQMPLRAVIRYEDGEVFDTVARN
ncbi:MAG: Ni/Fe hydrogenase subunit alpha [Candidatus Methanoplasma sp.]|jgi:F420-non-reducing hydrogenase large subunit|nr:Ni/Fe hydrogenase subunit alpha [Candidatus Methanoplasma sp.]